MGRVVGMACVSGRKGARAESYGGVERGRHCLAGQEGTLVFEIHCLWGESAIDDLVRLARLKDSLF